MITRITGIVLQIVRHNDRHNIVTLFTRQRGRMAFVSAAGGGKSGRMRAALIAPMAVVESDVNFQPSKNLQLLGSISSPIIWRNIYFDPMKGAMTFFLAEFLNRLLRDSEVADEPLWQFLISSLSALDTLKHGMANFHLTFLIRLLPFVGIEPDLSELSDGCVFDLREGRMVMQPPYAHRDWLSAEESAMLPLLARMNFRNMHLFKFNVEQRRRLLSMLMHYYAIHLPVKEELQSLEVLRELFND